MNNINEQKTETVKGSKCKPCSAIFYVLQEVGCIYNTLISILA